MATPITSRMCLRCIRSRHAAWRAVEATSMSPWVRSSFKPPYFDLLSPSQQPQRLVSTRASPPRIRKTVTLQEKRHFSNSTRRRAVAVQNPRTDDSGNDMLIHITPRAAHRLQAIAEKDGNPNLALRVSVESGGCHGFQYLMSLTNTSEADPEEDTVFEDGDGIKRKEERERADCYKAKVIMDEPSLELLKGSSVDYTMELIGSQFKMTGIPGAKSSCGCGTSFDIAT